MKIERVVAHPLAARAPKPVSFAIGDYSTFYATLVEVTTDDGLTGVGECIARKAPQVTAAVVDELLAPLLLGRDPRDIAGLWEQMFAQLRRWGHSRGFVLEAMSGVDTALWDLLARGAGEPLYRSLRGAGRDPVACYASKVYLTDIKRMATEAAAMTRRGFRAIKVQIGRTEALGGLRADVESVRAIRESVGPEVAIMLDANGAYDAATAIRLGRQLEPFDITWLEEPVPPDDISGYALVRRGQAVPLAAGESEFGVFGFRDLIERRAVDVLQPEIGRIGGFTAALRLGALAYAYNLRIAPHTGFSAGVAHLATLHLAAAVPNFMTYEYMLPELLSADGYTENPLRDIFTAPFPEPREGALDLPQGPGLGLEVDWKRVGAFEV
ncbi:MAG: mandelate racemase/muconate lactonizing enzyme family protein [Armatimonadetes bacterium]|nr:mandelate racemase/muconate lactonizing enzyme family protein [Armatimonadota bacterium]